MTARSILLPGDHQQRGGRQELLLVAASKPGEDDDVIDARRQQHEQHADEERLVVRDDPRQQPHDTGHEYEVDDQDRREEPPIAERTTDPAERNAEERGVKQQGQHCVDRELR